MPSPKRHHQRIMLDHDISLAKEKVTEPAESGKNASEWRFWCFRLVVWCWRGRYLPLRPKLPSIVDEDTGRRSAIRSCVKLTMLVYTDAWFKPPRHLHPYHLPSCTKVCLSDQQVCFPLTTSCHFGDCGTKDIVINGINAQNKHFPISITFLCEMGWPIRYRGNRAKNPS